MGVMDIIPLEAVVLGEHQGYGGSSGSLHSGSLSSRSRTTASLFCSLRRHYLCEVGQDHLSLHPADHSSVLWQGLGLLLQEKQRSCLIPGTGEKQVC